MNKSTYLERAAITGSFKTKADADRWVAEKLRDGYSVTGPSNNHRFAYSRALPWEVTASASFTIEAQWS